VHRPLSMMWFERQCWSISQASKSFSLPLSFLVLVIL
jgi:hypothetical protein